MLRLAREIARPDVSDCEEDDAMMRMMQVHRSPTAHRVIYIEIKGTSEEYPWTLWVGFDRSVFERRPVEAHLNGCSLFWHYHQVWDWAFWACFMDQVIGVEGAFDQLALHFPTAPSFHYRFRLNRAWPFADIDFCYPGMRNRELYARSKALIAEMWRE